MLLTVLELIPAKIYSHPLLYTTLCPMTTILRLIFICFMSLSTKCSLNGNKIFQ